MESQGPSIPEFAAGKATQKHWSRLGAEKRTGVCVPLFSLRSDRQMGVGDTADLKDLVALCKAIGASVIQLLPLNDLGMDSAPYSAISAFALDPLYLAVEEAPGFLSHADLAKRLEQARRALNTRERVNALEVRRQKLDLLWDWFQRGTSAEMDAAVAEFRRANPWLPDYLEYRVIKEIQGYRDWEHWDPEFADSRHREGIMAEHDDRVRFYEVIQWLLFSQLSAARQFANEHGVFIEGDVPILVARDSADVWKNQGLFHMDTVAGAPPDMYAREGQNWGFPTYNWRNIEQDGYRWWRERLEVASRTMDLVRVDHVVGFFRIWTIPLGETSGRNGWFIPQEERLWGDHGRGILQMMLDASPMLPLAEDLGTIPHVCRNTLNEMGICGLKVQRWEKWWEGDRSFLRQEHYSPLSVATLSTHDSEIFADWWTREPGERQELWTLLGRQGQAPASVDKDLGLEVLRWMAGVESTFVVHLLQDLLSPFGLLPGEPRFHRVNVPGIVTSENWSWRCPVATKHLLEHPEVAPTLKEVLRRG